MNQSFPETEPIETEADQDQNQTQLSESQQYPTYPTDLWDYLTGEYHQNIPYMPSREDRDQLNQLPEDEKRRVQIWDYFFRIKPNDVGKPHRKEIDNLQQGKKKKISAYHAAISGNSARLQKLHDSLKDDQLRYEGSGEIPAQIASLEEEIRETVPQMRPYRLIVLGVAFLGLVLYQLEYVSFFICGIPFGISFILWWIYRINTKSKRKELKNHQAELADIEKSYPVRKRKAEQEVAVLEQELNNLNLKHKSNIEMIDKRISYLQSAIKDLEQQIPKPPSDDTVSTWFNEDLKRLRRDSINNTVSVDVKSEIKTIRAYNSEDIAIEVENPISFINPGDLQDPQRIPPPYTPPQHNVLERIALGTEQPETKLNDISFLSNLINSTQLPNRLQPKPTPNRARHLLIKRNAEINEKEYTVFYGVYYIEYLTIGEDMMTLHGFFFDFITGKTTADRITEQYYQDVVAIEQSKEFRTIPLSYQDNDKTLDIEDAPTFSLTLPSGDRRTVTFANEAYLIGITKEFKAGQDLSEEGRQYIENQIEDSKIKATAAIDALRLQLRKKKGSAH